MFREDYLLTNETEKRLYESQQCRSGMYGRNSTSHFYICSIIKNYCFFSLVLIFSNAPFIDKNQLYNS